MAYRLHCYFPTSRRHIAPIPPQLSRPVLYMVKIIPGSPFGTTTEIDIHHIGLVSVCSDGCCARVFSRTCACLWSPRVQVGLGTVLPTQVLYTVYLQHLRWRLPNSTNKVASFPSGWIPGRKRKPVGRMPMSMSNCPSLASLPPKKPPCGWFRRSCPAFCAMASLLAWQSYFSGFSSTTSPAV